MAQLGRGVDNQAIGLDMQPAVLNHSEGVNRAGGVTVWTENGQKIAYATDQFGRRLLDAKGQPVKLSSDEAGGVQRRLDGEQQRAAAEAQKGLEQQKPDLGSMVPAVQSPGKRLQDRQQSVDNYQKQVHQ